MAMANSTLLFYHFVYHLNQIIPYKIWQQPTKSADLLICPVFRPRPNLVDKTSHLRLIPNCLVLNTMNRMNFTSLPIEELSNAFSISNSSICISTSKELLLTYSVIQSSFFFTTISGDVYLQQYLHPRTNRRTIITNVFSNSTLG